MDPEVAYSSLIDPSLDIDSRLDAGEALVGWLICGGYVPAQLVRLLADVAPYGAASKGRSRDYVAGFMASLLIEQSLAKSNG